VEHLAAQRPPDDAQATEIERLERLVAELTELVARLQAENEELRRSGKRQATPFSKGKRKQNPKRPGRKPGSGPFTYRQPPAPETVTNWVEVPVTAARCPVCGGILETERVDPAWVTDVPEPEPTVTEYAVEVCRCRTCGKLVRGEHADVAPDQVGAAAHRLGQRALALAHVLRCGVGIPVRKVPAVFQQFAGLRMTQSALTQDALRRARREVGQAYAELRATVKHSSKVHTDDTSWSVGGDGAHLMGFDTDEAAVYQVRPRHRNDEVRELIPGDYAGTMGCDRGRSYDARGLLGVKQQKCMSHIQRSISGVLGLQRGE
jgi:transposase